MISPSDPFWSETPERLLPRYAASITRIDGGTVETIGLTDYLSAAALMRALAEQAQHRGWQIAPAPPPAPLTGSG